MNLFCKLFNHKWNQTKMNGKDMMDAIQEDAVKYFESRGHTVETPMPSKDKIRKFPRLKKLVEEEQEEKRKK